MYQPKYEDFKNEMESLLSDYSVRVYVCEDRGKKTGKNGLEASKVTGPSVTLDILYRAIDWAANNSRKAQYQKALPEQKLNDGMSIEEIKDFFLAVEEATLFCTKTSSIK